MQEWVLAFKANVHSSDRRESGTHRGPKLSALDLPARRTGLHSSRATRQLRDSNPGKHGSPCHLLVCTQQRLVVLLRCDGDGWLGDRRLRNLQTGPQGGKSDARPQISARKVGESLQDLRALGPGRDRSSRPLASASADGPIRPCRGRHEYPVRKFLFALTMGRFARYTLLAFLAARYGRKIIRLMSQHGHPALWVVVGLIVTVAAVLVVFIARKRQRASSRGVVLN